MKLYHEFLQEHYHAPRNSTPIPHPTFEVTHSNRSCGDYITITGIIENNRLTQIYQYSSGCVISTATGSILSEFCKGKTVSEIIAITPEHIQELIKLPLGPTRLQCALLPLHALIAGINNA